MEACIVVCRTNKEIRKRGKILIINAVREVVRKSAQSWLEDRHIQKIAAAYDEYTDVEGFARIIDIAEAERNNFSLSIPLYVRETADEAERSNIKLAESIEAWMESSMAMKTSFSELTRLLAETADAENE
jgi:type I restriction enzyme M protein